jgi:hypothetical protein
MRLTRLVMWPLKVADANPHFSYQLACSADRDTMA